MYAIYVMLGGLALIIRVHSRPGLWPWHVAIPEPGPTIAPCCGSQRREEDHGPGAEGLNGRPAAAHQSTGPSRWTIQPAIPFFFFPADLRGRVSSTPCTSCTAASDAGGWSKCEAWGASAPTRCCFISRRTERLTLYHLQVSSSTNLHGAERGGLAYLVFKALLGVCSNRLRPRSNMPYVHQRRAGGGRSWHC
ncbi:unnamed protein product [Boreogadus saida]